MKSECYGSRGAILTTHSLQSWRDISVGSFDQRWDNGTERSLLAICLPATATVVPYALKRAANNTLLTYRLPSRSAISCAGIRATRRNMTDLLLLGSDHKLLMVTHGLRPFDIDFTLEKSASVSNGADMDVDAPSPTRLHGPIVALHHAIGSSVTVRFQDGTNMRATIDLFPQNVTTMQILSMLSLTLPSDLFYQIHKSFLIRWAAEGLCTGGMVELNCCIDTLCAVFGIGDRREPEPDSLTWDTLSASRSFDRLREDPVLRALKRPPRLTPSRSDPGKPHEYLAPLLYSLHMIGQDLRLMTVGYPSLIRLVPIICRIASIIRPEWADYWKRLCPDAIPEWPTTTACEWSCWIVWSMFDGRFKLNTWMIVSKCGLAMFLPF
jgi:anaphase-promoting complex subunit 1